MSLPPGTYNAAASLGLIGKVTLVGAEGGASLVEDEWTIKIGGTFMTTASSVMEINGAGLSSNVHWVVDGAITLGAYSVAVGEMTTNGAMTVGAGFTNTPSFAFGNSPEIFTFIIGGALTMSAGSVMTIGEGVSDAGVNWIVTGAITFGAGSIAVGNMESTAGAITLGALASSSNLKAFGGLTVGAEATTGALQAKGAITGGNPLQILDYDDCTGVKWVDCPGTTIVV
jgi:hypothetical protein